MEGFSRFQGNGRMMAHAVYGPDGTTLLSWRVLLLPYIEECSLFKVFEMNELWDSPHNIKFLDKMPSKFALSRKNRNPGETFYQVFTGPRTAFPDRPGAEWPLFNDCADRLLVVEAVTGVLTHLVVSLATGRLDPASWLPRVGDG